MSRTARFRIFPQFDEGYALPETVAIEHPPGGIGPGPSDHRIRVANAIDKTQPYTPGESLPPYRGATFPPAQPDRFGHFDMIPIDTPQFCAAHVYATVRLGLQTWRRYLGGDFAFWFSNIVPVLELVPRVAWPNAQSGPGYLEAGEVVNRYGVLDPFWMNFDVVTHEVGHMTMFSVMGVPDDSSVHGAFLAFHEAFADLFALTGALQFRSVRERLLAQTGGNLYVENLVSRIGELSNWTQVRLASNSTTMADVSGIALASDGQWIDAQGLGRGLFELAQPLTGAIFDCLVELFQDGLVSRHLIPPEAGRIGWDRAEVASSLDRIATVSREGYARFAAGFEASLDDARDAVCACMAHVLKTVRPETLTFDEVARRFLDGAALLGLSRRLPALAEHFTARGIMSANKLVGYSTLRRQGVPVKRAADCGCRSPTGFLLAGALIRHGHRLRADPG